MRGTEPIKIEEPFEGDYKVYYVNGGRCSGKVNKIINELVDRVNELQQENKKYKEVIDRAIEYIRIYRSYQKIDNKDYLKGRDEIGCLDIYQVDELLDILKEVE